MRYNLLPSKFQKGPIKEITEFILLILLFSVFIFAGIYLYFQYMNQNIESKIAEYDSKISTVQTDLREITQKVREHEYYEEVSERVGDNGDMRLEPLYKEFDISKFLYALVETLDTEVLFFYANINDSVFQLQGQALEYDDAETFYTDFKERIPEFYDVMFVELKDVEVVPTIEEGNHAIKEVVIFTIEGAVDEEALEQLRLEQEQQNEEGAGTDGEGSEEVENDE